MKVPLMMEFGDKNILVIGLGRVGRRRAAFLRDAGCRVSAVDTKALPQDWDTTGIHIIRREYGMNLLKGVDVAVIATDDHMLNQWIANDCKANGILCNCADDPEISDFIFPAVVRRGDLTLSVCTEGASPFMTRKIADELAKVYGPEMGEKLQLMRQLRQRALNSDMDTMQKRHYLKGLVDKSLEELKQEAAKDE
ncbi:MAG: bifunctional precorrin-2 dehydrogenase/sirohydrochlorin ferrochelatase [Eubacteriaceae bacterium]|nr:bifunctional precorrin-2 dehydrogenase/sirohydrochlorin ferrochelatase [Eubacteriaceae bacterium]